MIPQHSRGPAHISPVSLLSCFLLFGNTHVGAACPAAAAALLPHITSRAKMTPSTATAGPAPSQGQSSASLGRLGVLCARWWGPGLGVTPSVRGNRHELLGYKGKDVDDASSKAPLGRSSPARGGQICCLAVIFVLRTLARNWSCVRLS